MNGKNRPHRHVRDNRNLPENGGRGYLELYNLENVKVGQVLFYWDETTRALEMQQMDIFADYQRKGYGIEILMRLSEIHPDIRLADNPQSNTAEGDALLLAARKAGIVIHRFECGKRLGHCLCAES
jgi:hypothetical protein